MQMSLDLLNTMNIANELQLNLFFIKSKAFGKKFVFQVPLKYFETEF